MVGNRPALLAGAEGIEPSYPVLPARQISQKMARVVGIEPTLEVLETSVLPLYYTRRIILAGGETGILPLNYAPIKSAGLENCGLPLTGTRLRPL